MASSLASPPVLTSIGSGHIFKETQTFTIRCPDRFFRDGILCDSSGTKIFDCAAPNPFTSWNLRRNLTDTSGQQILELRHHKSKLKQWIIEDPEGKELCMVEDVSKMRITALEARVRMDGGEVTICVRSFDAAGTRTVFRVEDVTVAEMMVTDNNDAHFLKGRGLDRTAWRLEVASGVDVALIAALAFVRVEVMHSRRR